MNIAVKKFIHHMRYSNVWYTQWNFSTDITFYELYYKYYDILACSSELSSGASEGICHILEGSFFVNWYWYNQKYLYLKSKSWCENDTVFLPSTYCTCLTQCIFCTLQSSILKRMAKPRQAMQRRVCYIK